MFEKADDASDISGRYGSEDDGEEAEDEDEANSEAPHSANESDMDRLMQGMEEDEMVNDDLKMPSDLEGDEEESEDEGIFGDGGPIDDGEDDYDEPKPSKKQLLDKESDAEDEIENVFAMARTNKENDLVEAIKSKGDFINEELFKKMDSIEADMMQKKDWNMLGEAKASERPKNSLLEVHLDFNTATKLPPTITKETTSAIDALIKQRVLDELFDDPVLVQGDGKKRKKLGDGEEMDFSKSKKGLGELYGDDLQKRLM